MVATNWRKRERMFVDGTIEQRVEQLTLTSLQMAMQDINDQLQRQGLEPLPSSAFLPKKSETSPEPIEGFYPIIRAAVCRELSLRSPLNLPENDRARLIRMSAMFDQTVDPELECERMIRDHPSLELAYHAPEPLARHIEIIAKSAIRDYIQNKPSDPHERPTGLSR